MRSIRSITRFLALPLAMAAFMLAAHQSGGLVLRTSAPAQFASLRYPPRQARIAALALTRYTARAGPLDPFPSPRSRAWPTCRSFRS